MRRALWEEKAIRYVTRMETCVVHALYGTSCALPCFEMPFGGGHHKAPKDQELRDYAPGTKQTPWPLVRKRTIPTERLPLVGEI
jgi:hypothetical protein